MKKNLYVLMRRANVQGMTTTFHLEPDRLGPQVRKNAVRMLREGFVHGRGNAANIALSVAEHVGIELPHNYYGGTIIFRQDLYTPDGSQEIIDRYRATLTAEILDCGSNSSSWRLDSLRNTLANADTIFSDRDRYVQFYDMETPAVREFLLSLIRPVIKERLEQAAQMLLSSIPIHIETYRSN
jgi:hypothetical protein